jgi:hypothetical protein
MLPSNQNSAERNHAEQDARVPADTREHGKCTLLLSCTDGERRSGKERDLEQCEAADDADEQDADQVRTTAIVANEPTPGRWRIE